MPFQLNFGFHRGDFTENILVHSEFPTNTLQTMYVWLKSVSNERYLIFRPYLGFPLRDFRKTSYLALSTYALRMVYIGLRSVNDEGT